MEMSENKKEGREHGLRMDSQKPIFRSLAIIEERIQEKLTVESLAGNLHFSRYHYQRLFREAVGESVMRYVTRRRIALSAAELADTDLSVLEIALKYGYDSPEGFGRSFKTYTGVTPSEYRKYHLSIRPPKTEKERRAMMYSKTTDEIIRELNNLIVQAEETAAFDEKVKERKEAALYGEFLDLLAARTRELSGGLSRTLESITGIAACPDQISARFLIIRTIEDAAFWSAIVSFQARLTIARADGQHRAALMPVCEKYEALAGRARMKAEKIADFFNELSTLIFQDMRKGAESRLQNAIQAGKTAGERILADPALPYAWIGEEVLTIVRELSSVSFEEMTEGILDDCLMRVDIIAFAADVDVLRQPCHRPLFEGISQFRAEIGEALSFFQGLSREVFGGAGKVEEAGKNLTLERTVDKRLGDLAFQGNILLFYLKGEIRKLADHLSGEQNAAFARICSRMDEVIRLIHQAKGEEDTEKIAENFRISCEGIMETAAGLGDYGAVVGLIGEEIGRMSRAIEAK